MSHMVMLTILLILRIVGFPASFFFFCLRRTLDLSVPGQIFVTNHRIITAR